MKKIMQLLGLMPGTAVLNNTHVHSSRNPESLDIHAFTNWCKELNVSCLAPKNADFQVIIGNHVKHVRLERDAAM